MLSKTIACKIVIFENTIYNKKLIVIVYNVIKINYK